MKKKHTKGIFLLILITGFAGTYSVKAQDIHFSQFYMSPLTQNPAMAGALNDLQATLNYRDQWKAVPAPFKTMAFSFDMKLNKKKAKKGFWAAGLNFFNDKAGLPQLSTTQGNFTAAYHVLLNKYSKLGIGLQGGFLQRTLISSGLQWGSQYVGGSYNAGTPSGEPGEGSANKTTGDFGTGLMWSYNNTAGDINVTDNHDLKANLGVSVLHINQPEYSFYNTIPEKLYMKYVLQGSALVSIKNTNIAMAPHFMYVLQGKTQEIYAGGLLRYKLKQDSKYTGRNAGSAISLGAFYRAKDAIALNLLFELGQYAFGFSYDVNTSGLTKASGGRGGFEVSLRFINPNPFLYGSHTRY